VAEDHPMTCTMRVGMRFCPLEYVRIMSKELERKMKGYVTECCCAMKLDGLIPCDDVLCVDIRDVAEGCNYTSEESEQVVSDYTRIIEVY